MEVCFYKVSTNNIETLEVSKKSLHHRRSIIIQDNKSKQLFLKNGSSVNQTLILKSRQKIKELNASLGFNYTITNIEEDEKIIKNLTSKKPFPRKTPLKQIQIKNRRWLLKSILESTLSRESYHNAESAKLKYNPEISRFSTIKDERIPIERSLAQVSSKEKQFNQFLKLINLLANIMRKENSKENITKELHSEISIFLEMCS